MSIVPRELINQTPGFAGRLVRWIIDTSLYQQPQLALAATLAAVGTLKGQKVASETNLRTNHFVVGLGLPSSGKGHGINAIDKLFTEIGAEHRIAGTPVSDTALLSCLVEGKGVKLIQWDEIGLGLSKITNPKAPSYKANIINVLMQLFSSASKSYRGNEYANADRKKDRIDIKQPCLSIYGVSTPVRFYEALNSDFGSDGFLSRLLVFETSLDHPEPAKNPEPFYLSEAMATNARAILDEEIPEDENDLDSFYNGPKPRTIKYASKTAFNLKTYLIPKYDELKRKEKLEILQSIHGRSVEHIIKIALTVEPMDEISVDTLEWAEKLYDHLAETLINIISHKVSNSEFQRNLNKIVDIIKKVPSISHSDLIRSTQWLNRRERIELIATLIESERISHFKENVGTSRKPTAFYSYQYK